MPVSGSEKPMRTGSAACASAAANATRPHAAKIVAKRFMIHIPYADVVFEEASSDRETSLAALHRDPFDLSHFFHRETATFAPVPAVFYSAERYMRLVGHRAVVDVYHSGVELKGKVE